MVFLKKYGFIGLIYFVFNMLLFVFWWVVTDPGNYIWHTIPANKEVLLVSACNKLFLIKYYISFVLLNTILTGIVFYELKRMIQIGIVMFSLAFYCITKYLFDPFVGRDYYVIFENQNVSKNFFLEPVSEAGSSIGPFLLHKLNDKPSFVREQAAKGLGIIKYTTAIDRLNEILNDSTEDISMRAECFYALNKINTPESKTELEQFSITHSIQTGDSLLIERINFVELQDIY